MKSKKEKKSENKSKTAVDFKTKLAVFLTLAIIVIAGIVFGSVFLYHQIFTENPRFNLSKLIVESNGYWNNKNNELLRLTDLKLHKDNIWKLSLSSLRKKVLLLPGVENCDVIRVIPDTIQFIITERIPRAQLAEFRAVMADSDTYAIPTAVAMKTNGKLPFIMGLDPKLEIKVNQKIPELEFAMFLIMKTIRDFSEFEIIAINVENPDYYTLYLRYNGGKRKMVIMPVNYQDVDIKFIALRTAMSQAEIKNVEYRVFDLSFKDRVVCK